MVKKRVWFLVLVQLAMVAGCATMASRWRDADSANSIDAYKGFLARYPEGEYSQKASARVESLSFRRAEEYGAVSSYNQFLAEYPRGTFVDSALSQIRKLTEAQKLREEEEKRRREEADYRDAVASGSYVELESFLVNYPGSMYEGDVKARMAQYTTEVLNWPVTVEWQRINRRLLDGAEFNSSVQRGSFGILSYMEIASKQPGDTQAMIFSDDPGMPFGMGVLFVKATGAYLQLPGRVVAIRPAKLRLQSTYVDRASDSRNFRFYTAAEGEMIPFVSSNAVLVEGSVLMPDPGHFTDLYGTECRGGSVVVTATGLQFQPGTEVVRSK